MAEHNVLGDRGEQLAKSYLEKIGYQIVATNWRVQKYEIDIVAIDENEMVFVEVKTRSSDVFGAPEEAVTLKKQKHLIDGADFYIHDNEVDLECRFDVVSIILNSNQEELNHIKNAFTSEA